MRKSAAVVLLACFGIYHLGYFVVQFLMPLAIQRHWEEQIWADDESALEGRLVRVPFSMPYGQNQENFQTVNFPMEIDGKTHRVIKQRYFDDHLEVIVVQDDLHMKFEEQVRLWISSLGSDKEGFEGTPLQKILLKSFVKDFVPNSLDWSISTGFSEIPLTYPSKFSASVPTGTADIVLPPPRHNSLR